MKSLRRHYDVIFENFVKQQASAKIHIFIESVSQIIYFWVDISLKAHCFLICVKKSTIFERQLKNGTLFVIKAIIMLMTSSKQYQLLLF